MIATFTEHVLVIDASRPAVPDGKQREHAEFTAALCGLLAQLPRDDRMTLTLFGAYVDHVYSGVKVDLVRPFTPESLEPYRSTVLPFDPFNIAFLPALGSTIDHVGARLSNTPEECRPGRVLVTAVLRSNGHTAMGTDLTRPVAVPYGIRSVCSAVRRQASVYSWLFRIFGVRSSGCTEGHLSSTAEEEGIDRYEMKDRLWNVAGDYMAGL